MAQNSPSDLSSPSVSNRFEYLSMSADSTVRSSSVFTDSSLLREESPDDSSPPRLASSRAVADSCSPLVGRVGSILSMRRLGAATAHRWTQIQTSCLILAACARRLLSGLPLLPPHSASCVRRVRRLRLAMFGTLHGYTGNWAAARIVGKLQATSRRRRPVCPWSTKGSRRTRE